MNYWKDKEIRDRILFTFWICFVFYVIGRIPLPLSISMDDNEALNNMLQLMAGSSRLSLFMLGVGPYVTVSIVIQLLGIFESLPFHKWREAGPAGQEKLKRVTYVATFVVGLLESSTLILAMNSVQATHLLAEMNWFLMAFILISIAGGSLFTVFLSNQINEKGVGSGMTMFIVTNVAANLPATLINEVRISIDKEVPDYWFLVIGFMIILLVGAFIMFVLQVERRVYIHSFNFAIDDKLHYIPIKALASSVLPVIIVSTMFTLLQQVEKYANINMEGFFDTTRYRGIILYGFLTWLFTYWYNYIQLNPEDIAKQLRESQFYIKGFSAEKMESYLNQQIVKASHVGAPALALIVVLPLLLVHLIGNTHQITFFLSTSFILLISGTIEFAKQISGLHVSRSYHDLLGGVE